MSFPRASGHPDYSSAGTSKFIPEVWSGKLVMNLYDATVLPSITNTDYEGEIKGHGDKVVIRTTPVTSVKPYTKVMKLTYDRPDSPSLELLIDQGFYWAFVVDHVDKYQADVPLMDGWSKDASERLKISLDTDVLGWLPPLADSHNQGLTAGVRSLAFNMGVAGTPFAVTPTNVLDCIVDMGTVLDEQNCPEDGRFIVMPPLFVGMIKKSDIKDASLTGDGSSVLRNGRIGMIDRFTVYSSNLLTTVAEGAGTTYKMPFGHKMAATFATQITETESLKAESTFGDLVRGLLVYGRAIIKDETLGMFYAYKG
jgi:hypothetical protein